MMSHLTGSSALAFSMPRADASMKERSPNGFGVISAQVNWAAASVGVAAGAQAVSITDATSKRLQTKSKRFFISFSPIFDWFEETLRKIYELSRHHLLHFKKIESLQRTTCSWTVDQDPQFLKEAFFQSDFLIDQISRLYIKRRVK